MAKTGAWMRVRDLVAARSGNIALIFALLAPLLVVMAGGAIDVTDASMRQAQLQQAVDAASVSAVARNSPGYTTGLQMNTDGSVSNSVTLANATAVFNANWRSPGDTSTPTIGGNASPCNASTLVCKSGTVIYSNVTATAAFTPLFLGLLKYLGQPGMTSIKLYASAKSADNIPAYMNFYLLLDNTPSMGIAATTAGIQTMVNNTPDQCAFACHDMNDNNNYYNLAKKLGVNTRIYNVAQAAANLLSTAQNTETTNGISNEFSVAVYDFGTTATDPTSPSYNPLTQVFPSQVNTVSSDLKSAATATAAIDLMTVYGQGQYNDQDTNLESPLSYAVRYLPSPGNGASASTAKEVLFFVTDGMDDAYNCSRNDSATCRYIQPLNSASYFPSPTACDKIKAKGVQIALLYTSYLPLPQNNFYLTYVAPYNVSNAGVTQIEAAMKACASPGFYFEVDSNSDINTAMQALFQKVVASVRITG